MEFSFSSLLLNWYDNNRRHLPWREDPTPYHVYLSEIMLQQTRVEAVKDYYARFLEAFPDIKSLASADEEKVLKLWEGLGYYSRAKNLHQSAKVIVSKYGGELPSSIDDLRLLPGVGEYTSKAIASIAFGQKEISIDGNLFRIYSRLNMDPAPLQMLSSKQKAESYFGERLEDRPGDFNQALMDLGEMVCLPHGFPLCDQCPFASFCKAHLSKQEVFYPCAPSPIRKKEERRTVLLVCFDNQVALHKRPSVGLLASVYEFPNVLGWMNQEEVVRYLKDLGFQIASMEEIGESKHVFSHLVWKMKGYRAQVHNKANELDFVYASKEEIDQSYPLPSAFSYFRQKL